MKNSKWMALPVGLMLALSSGCVIHAECTPDCSGHCCGYDGCGGTCPDSCAQTGQICSEGTCACEGECAPRTCQDLLRECGSWEDGCGHSLDCGSCPAGESCSDDGECKNSCQPQDCVALGKECGSWNDGCDTMIFCGSCPAEQSCDGLGQCEAASCPVGMRRCGDGCVDTSIDPQHCGACDNDCDADQLCDGGSCEDPPDRCPPEGCALGSYCDLTVDRCVPGCQDDAGCAARYICEERTCVVGCRRTPDCDPGQACVELSCEICAFDDDQDGHYAGGSCLSPSDDCNDSDPEVYGGRPEVCDGKDNDCDGGVDEGVQSTYYQDRDDDGWGGSVTTLACARPEGYVGRSGDCDDGDPQMAPGRSEVCDGKDNDCDDDIDDDLTPPPCGLSVGVCEGSTRRCGGTAGWLDCDEADYGQDYEASETTCDALDNDCDGDVDGLSRSCSTHHQGPCAVGTEICEAGLWEGCPDPSDEECDGVDNNCNGRVDEELVPPSCTLYQGVCAAAEKQCDGVDGWTDCSVEDYGVDYEETEVSCDDRDNDCDGVTDGMTRPCSEERFGICAEGDESCASGVWGGCPEPELESCGDELDNDCDSVVDEPGGLDGPITTVGAGAHPRIRAIADGFLAAWLDEGGDILLLKLSDAGTPVGEPTAHPPIARPILLLDIVPFDGGVGLAWVEERPEECCGPTQTWVRVLDDSLVPTGDAVLFPSSGSNWDRTEELRVGSHSGGAGVVVAERIFTDSPDYGSRYRFGLFPSSSPASSEINFDRHGSQAQGPSSHFSIAELPSGFAMAWVPLGTWDSAQIAAYTDTGAELWSPRAVHADSLGTAASVTYDGATLMSLHHYHRWYNRPFDPTDGTPGTEESSEFFLYWPRAADAAYLGEQHLQLLESEGDIYTALFDSSGAIIGSPTLVQERVAEGCGGQCARMAVRPGAIGLLTSDDGEVLFAPLCR